VSEAVASVPLGAALPVTVELSLLAIAVATLAMVGWGVNVVGGVAAG